MGRSPVVAEVPFFVAFLWSDYADAPLPSSPSHPLQIGAIRTSVATPEALFEHFEWVEYLNRCGWAGADQ